MSYDPFHNKAAPSRGSTGSAMFVIVILLWTILIAFILADVL